MPIYDYECKACGHAFDALQKISDDALVDCPDCGKPELRKLLSAPRFRLKGGGWYETDFKTGSKRNLAGSGDKKADAKDGDKPKKEKKDTSKSSEKSSGGGKAA